MNLTTARSWVRDHARNAQDSSMYSDTSVDRAIQQAGNEFLRITNYLFQADTAAVTGGSAAVSLSGISGFRSELFDAAWIDSGEDLAALSFSDIRSHRATSAISGTPTKMGFDSNTSIQLYPTPSVNGTLSVLWRPRLTTWTPGDNSPGSITLNIPDDILGLIVLPIGAPAALQRNEPEHKYAGPLWADYQTRCREMVGFGNRGARAVERSMVEE